MSDSRQSASAVQFRLRSLALIVLAICVLLAAVSPWLRQMKPEQLRRFCLFFLGELACMAMTVVGYGALLRRAEARGGKVYFVLPRFRARAIRSAWIASGIVCVWALFLAAFFGSKGKPGWLDYLNYFNAFNAGVGNGSWLTVVWWRFDQIQLREHGVLFWRRLIPWNSLREWNWAENGRQLLLEYQIKKYRSRIRAVVPEAERSEIEAFLEQRCPDDKDQG